MRRHFLIYLFLALLLGCGLDQSRRGDEPAANTSPALAAAVADLQARLSQLENARKKTYESEINLTEGQYTKVYSNVGYFLVLCDDVKPYLNGYRLNLRIGNPYSVIFSDCKLVARWGPAYDLKTATYDVWHARLSSKTFSVAKDLQPATWNRVQLTIAPASAADLAYFALSISASSASMKVEQ